MSLILSFSVPVTSELKVYQVDPQTLKTHPQLNMKIRLCAIESFIQ
jgi:hypothetical protein